MLIAWQRRSCAAIRLKWPACTSTHWYARCKAILCSSRVPLLRTLFLAVAVVLLIACFNLAGLMLVRAIRRQREVAVRLALGARASALIRQAVLESLVL